MLKAEQIPWQTKEQLGRWLASGASHGECIAAAINAWPGMSIADDDDWCDIRKGWITLPKESSNDK